MAVSKANQRAVNKYKKNNYDRIEITVSKGQRAVFHAHASSCGESVNGFIGRAISETMARDSGGVPSEITGNGPESTRGAGVVSLPSEAIKAAQEAAEATGETSARFIARAIDTQAQRDKSSLRLGINPATGGKLEKEA